MQKSILASSRFLHIARLIVGAIAILAVMFCGAKIVSALAYGDIAVSGTSGDIDVIDNEISGLTITPSLVFNEVGDSITYEIPLSDEGGTGFKINNVTDDNDNIYVTSTYSYDTTMDTNNKSVLVTLKYANSLPFGETLEMSDIHITIGIEEQGTIAAPDTGVLTAESQGATQSIRVNNLLPHLLIGFFAAIIAIVAVTPKVHHAKSIATGLALLIFVPALIISNQTYAEDTKIEVTIKTSNITAVPVINEPLDVVIFSFPNIYNNKVQDRTSGMAAGNAIIMKTLDNKYVLLDTGPKTTNIQEVIYDELKRLQGTENVVIDYLIISHLDSDHYGNATAIMNDDKYTIKNIVLKHEQYAEGYNKESVFTTITGTAKNRNINIITSGDAVTEAYMNTLIGSTDYDKLSEGMTIRVGQYLKLDFFNTSNVYDGKICKEGEGVAWTANIASSKLFKTPDEKYVYFDGSEYPNITLKMTDTLVAKENGSGINKYFYASIPSARNICRSNPNSFGILAEITTTGLKKYAYFANDIESAGFSSLNSGGNSSQQFENLAFDPESGKFITDVTPYTIPSELNATTSIYNKLSDDAVFLGVTVEELLDNIAIFQESHHGSNNNEEAIWKINLNREDGIYAIEEGSTNQASTTSWAQSKIYYYTLGNLPAENKLRAGDPDKDGIHCTIDMLGDTICAHYELEEQSTVNP